MILEDRLDIAEVEIAGDVAFAIREVRADRQRRFLGRATIIVGRRDVELRRVRRMARREKRLKGIIGVLMVVEAVRTIHLDAFEVALHDEVHDAGHGVRAVDRRRTASHDVDMVDERALCEALKSGRLSGAALDVFANEPYRGALCDSDKVILSPHQATLTVETRGAMETRAVENLLRCLKGEV